MYTYELKYYILCVTSMHFQVLFDTTVDTFLHAFFVK